MIYGIKKCMSYANGNYGYQVADSAWEQIGDGTIQTMPSQLVYWADNYRTGIVGGPELLDAQLSGAVDTEPGGSTHAPAWRLFDGDVATGSARTLMRSDLELGFTSRVPSRRAPRLRSWIAVPGRKPWAALACYRSRTAWMPRAASRCRQVSR